MKKILLTSGSSFSVDSVESDDDPSADINFKRWPTVLAEQLDFKLINKSKPNASNLYIYDHLMENILRNENEIGLVVAAWSYGFKTSLFRNYELNFINLSDQDINDKSLVNPVSQLAEKLKNQDQLVESIEQSLRLIVYLQEFCDSKKIKCIHYPLLNLFKTGLEKHSHVKVLEELKNSYFFKKIQKFDNILGWPSDTYLGGYTYATVHPNLVISNTDHHPNEQGQKNIAQEIHDKYLKL